MWGPLVNLKLSCWQSHTAVPSLKLSGRCKPTYSACVLFRFSWRSHKNHGHRRNHRLDVFLETDLSSHRPQRSFAVSVSIHYFAVILPRDILTLTEKQCICRQFFDMLRPEFWKGTEFGKKNCLSWNHGNVLRFFKPTSFMTNTLKLISWIYEKEAMVKPH